MALALATTPLATTHLQQRRTAAGVQAARQAPPRQQWVAAAAVSERRRLRRLRAADPSSSPPAPEDGEGLLPEEDAEIPGSYRDAMSTKTPLGKAVAGACDELNALGSLERQTLEEAEGLLKKLGFKGSLFAVPQQQEQQQQQGAQQPPEGQ